MWWSTLTLSNIICIWCIWAAPSPSQPLSLQFLLLAARKYQTSEDDGGDDFDDLLADVFRIRVLGLWLMFDLLIDWLIDNDVLHFPHIMITFGSDRGSFVWNSTSINLCEWAQWIDIHDFSKPITIKNHPTIDRMAIINTHNIQ